MIEFLEDGHIYLIEGVITPSVSQILSNTLFKGMYDNVPQYILNNKADFGTNVHKAIETDEVDDLTQLERIAYDQYQKLKRKHGFKPLKQELIVYYDNRYCGTFEILATLNDELVLIDIKTTYKVQEEYLSWQLSFYKYAYENMTGKEIKKAYCVWLPKQELGQFIEIQFKTKEEVLDLVQDYERNIE